MFITFFKLTKLIYRYRIDELIADYSNQKWISLFITFLPHNLLIKRLDSKKSRGELTREFLIEMGIYYVKLGQALSVRKDFIPQDICDELALLRDACPPFPGEQSIALIEKQLGKPINEIFSSFEIKPLASASIAQVHCAILHDGSDVVVKVVRPDIEERIEKNLKSIFSIAHFFNNWVKNTQPFRPIEVVEQFATVLQNEKDMLREAANANHIKDNFKNDPSIHVPKIFWNYTSSQVLVMERIYGIPIHQTQELKDANLSLKTLAESGVKIFFKQLFEHNLFHADMHPGNVFINNKGVYIAVDYGIVGALSKKDRLYIAENLLAFLDRDYRRVAELHIQSNWVDSNVSATELEAAIRSVSEPIYGKPLGEISFAHYLLQLLKIAREHGMIVQPQLVLLQKTLFNIEGLGRELYPNLDLWETASPILKKWMKQQYSPKSVIKDLQTQFPYWRLELPKLLNQFSSRSNDQDRQINLYKKIRLLVISTICMFSAVLSYFHPLAYFIADSDIPFGSIALGLVGLTLLYKSRLTN